MTVMLSSDPDADFKALTALMKESGNEEEKEAAADDDDDDMD